MKTQIKKSVKEFSLILSVMFTALVFAAGCAAPKPTPDPLVGFHASSLGNLDANKAITDDYKSYIQTLSPEEKKYLGPSPIGFFEDGTGQHAVEIKLGLNHSNWHHVLIYDKDNKRIKTIKYISGNSMS